MAPRGRSAVGSGMVDGFHSHGSMSMTEGEKERESELAELSYVKEVRCY